MAAFAALLLQLLVGISCILLEVWGQGTPFACCYAERKMVYGFCQPTSRQLPGVRNSRELEDCWTQAVEHFGNTTVVGAYNLTMAEKYFTFVVKIDRTAGSHMYARRPLLFDADTIPANSQPELGYLPFGLTISLPVDDPTGECPQFELHDLYIWFQMHQGQPRNLKRQYPGFKFDVSGCGREKQQLSNFSFRALGYANLELHFLTLRGEPLNETQALTTVCR